MVVPNVWHEGLETKQDVMDCYGEKNLVPIDLIKQIIFYTSRGVQPVFTCESEKEDKKRPAGMLVLEVRNPLGLRKMA